MIKVVKDIECFNSTDTQVRFYPTTKAILYNFMPMATATIISIAHRDQLEDIVEIYNQAIERGFCTADTTPFTANEKASWFDRHDDKHPLFIAIIDGKVAGWYSLSHYREGREALSGVRELSYYVHNDHQGKGIGAAMVKHAVETAKKLQVENIVAILLERNLRSISLLEKFGFEKWGHMPDVARFGNERCGHLYYGLKIVDREL
jgi:L-amino acid N-acyltransferase YncA